MNPNCSSVNVLPFEVLEGIFFYLEDCQRLESALVCQHWLSVLNSRRLLKGICLNVDEDNYEDLPALLTSTRNFPHIMFVDVILDKNFSQLIESNQYFLHKLSFQFCELKENDFLANESKLNCDKLKYLKIFGCSKEILELFSSLLNLQDLMIEDPNFNDCHLQRLQQITSKLKTIDLKDVPLGDFLDKSSTDDDEEDPDKDSQSLPSTEELSIPFIESFITQHSATLEDFSIDDLPQCAVSTIASIPHLKLKKFCFPGYYEPSLVVEFCRLQPSLTSIKVLDVSLERSHLEEIVHLLPRLECISFDHCVLQDISPLSKLKQLRALELLYCEINEDVSIPIPLNHLKKLKCTGMSSSFLMKLLSQTLYIQNLSLTDCGSDEIIRMISATLTHLKFLKMKDFLNPITDGQLTGRVLVKRETESTYLPVPISNLKGLTKLTLFGIDNVTKKGFLEAIRFPFLVHLEVEGRQIKKKIQPALFKRNPCLRKCIIK